MSRRQRVVVNGNEPEYVGTAQPEIVHYEIANPQKKGTIERLQETIIENTVNQYELEDRRQIAAIREFMERNPDISYVEYESNPVMRMDLVITRRGLIFKREEASISATLTPNRRFRDFHDASTEIGKAFSDYNECRPHSSIDYLPPREFRRKFLNDQTFREKFEEKEIEVTLDEN